MNEQKLQVQFKFKLKVKEYWRIFILDWERKKC